VLEEDHKLAEAEKVLNQMAAIDPKYEAIDTLRKRLDDLKAGK
jgi:hypothetical protein